MNLWPRPVALRLGTGGAGLRIGPDPRHAALDCPSVVTVRLCPPPDAGQEEAEEKLLEAQNVSFSHRLVALSLESSPSGTGGEGPGEGDGVLCA